MIPISLTAAVVALTQRRKPKPKRPHVFGCRYLKPRKRGAGWHAHIKSK